MKKMLAGFAGVVLSVAMMACGPQMTDEEVAAAEADVEVASQAITTYFCDSPLSGGVYTQNGWYSALGNCGAGLYSLTKCPIKAVTNHSTQNCPAGPKYRNSVAIH